MEEGRKGGREEGRKESEGRRERKGGLGGGGCGAVKEDTCVRLDKLHDVPAAKRASSAFINVLLA
eukprot:332605-Rhodomonas_salina.1